MLQQLSYPDYSSMRGLSADRIAIPTQYLNVLNAAFVETDTGVTWIWNGLSWQIPISLVMTGPSANRISLNTSQIPSGASYTETDTGVTWIWNGSHWVAGSSTQGPPGPPGPPGGIGPTGQAGLNFRQTYSAAVTYNTSGAQGPDFVTYNGSGYVCQQDTTTGIVPSVAVSSMTATFNAGVYTIAVVLAATGSLVAAIGNSIFISGASNSGTGGASLVNGTFTVSAYTDSQHFSFQVTAASGAIGTIGGAPISVNTPNWAILVLQGAPGPQGTQGPQGLQGPPGTGGAATAIDQSGARVASSAVNTAQALITTAITAALMTANGKLDGDIDLSLTNNSNAKTFALVFGGQTVLSVALASLSGARINYSITNRGATNAQRYTVTVVKSDGTLSLVTGNTSVDTTQAQNLVQQLTLANGSGGDSGAVEQRSLRLTNN